MFDIHDDMSHFMLAPKYKGKIDIDVIEQFDDIVSKCPTKRYATNHYGKFLFDVPNRRVYLIYRRYDLITKEEFLKSLSIFVELCRRKGFDFYYEPAISN
jgi:hypothetical protein